MNKIVIVGRLGTEPDVKEWDNGDKTTTLNVATSERFKNPKTEEWQEATTWHRVVVNGGQAGPCAEYLSKGSQVAVEGKYVSRTYNDKDGNERKIFELKSQRVEFLGSKGDSANPNAGGASGASEEVPF